MPALSLRQKIFYTSLGMMALAIAVIAFVIVPTVREIFELQENIQRIEEYFEGQYERTRTLRRSIANLESVTELIKTYEGALIAHGDELAVITTLESLSEKHELAQTLSVASIQSTGENAGARPTPGGIRNGSITFSIANQGPFIRQLRYVRDLERLPYYVFIDRLHWQRSRGAKPDDLGILTLRFNATVYIRDF